jgi:hypothetical protein
MVVSSDERATDYIDRSSGPCPHDRMRHGRRWCGCLPLIALGCHSELPQDRGRLWECLGFVERNGQTVAVFPSDTKIRLCANPDVPISDIKDECHFRCKVAFCTFGLSTAPPFLHLCSSSPGVGLSAKCNVQGATFIDLPCDDRAARLAVTSNGPARNEVSTSATAALDIDGHGGTTTARGPLRYTIHECATAPCAFEIPGFELEVADFSIDGKPVTSASVRNNRPVLGRHFANGSFEIPPGALAVSVVFQLSGKTGSTTLTNEAPVTGFAAPDSDEFSISGTFSKGDVSVDLTMSGSHTNRAPNAVIRPSGPVECNAPGAAQIDLDGRMSTDPDDNISELVWFVNGEMMRTAAPVVPATLPLGSNTIKLELVDSRVSIDTGFADVSVVDTTPPSFTTASSNPSCLWPPDHKYVRFSLGDQVQIGTADVCDPSPAVRVRRISSSEPDNGLGDGDTSHDVIYGDTGFCLRSERRGGGTGRTYSVELEARDASGNLSTRTIEVAVPPHHTPDCPALPPSSLLSDAEAATQCVF